MPQQYKDAQRLIDWLVDRCDNTGTLTVSTRDAQRFSPVRDGVRLDEALDVLTKANHVQLIRDGRKLLIELQPITE